MSNLSPLQGREADEVAIRALSQQLNEAWGNADAFTEDADYITFDGTLASGRAAIAQVPLRADHGCSQARGTLAVYGFPQYTLSPIHSHALWAPADALRPTSGYKSLFGVGLARREKQEESTWPERPAVHKRQWSDRSGWHAALYLSPEQS